jgi:MFS family permease
MHVFVDYVQQFRRFQRNARLYLISYVLSGVSAGIFLVLYNLYLASLGYGTDFIGAVLFLLTLGAGIAIFPAGICVDRFSGKTILIWSSVLIGIFGAAQILFRQPLPLLASGFFVGVAGAALLVVNAPFLTRNSTPEERPHLFSLTISLSLVTTVIGEVIGGALPVWFRSLPFLMAPLPGQFAWLLARQPEPRSYQLALLFAGLIAGPSFIPLFLMSDDRPSAQKKQVHADYAAAHPPLSDQAPARRAPARGATTFLRRGCDVFRNAMAFLAQIRWAQVWKWLHSAIFLLILVQVFLGLGAGLFSPYFNVYFVKHLGASSALFGVLAGGATAILALFTLVAPWLAARWGRINAIVLTQLSSIPLLVTLGLTNFLPLAAGIYLCRQGLMDMSMGVLQVFSMEVVPESHRGLANSSYQAAFQVSWALMAPVGGVIIAQFGYTPIFLLGAVFYLLEIVTLWGRFGQGRGKRVDEKIKPIDPEPAVKLLSEAE